MPAKRNHPDAPLVEEIVERLSPFADVSSRFMFGAFGLFVDGVMIGHVNDGTLYFRADDVNRPDFEAAGQRPWVYEYRRGTRMAMPYYPIPEDDFDDPDALRGWFESARAAAARNAKRKR